MTTIKETNLHILEDIVNQNEDRSGSVSGCSMHCGGITCDECPMNSNKSITLEAIRDELTSRTTVEAPEVDNKEPIEGVTKPSHYALFDGIESIEVIAHSMTVEMFRGFCFGNVLKYRLRAGKKSELAYAEKDLAKANFYTELFETHKEKCYDYQ